MRWVVPEGGPPAEVPNFLHPRNPFSENPSQRTLLSNSGSAREKQVPPGATHAAKQSVTRYFHSPRPIAEVVAVLCNVSLGKGAPQ